MLNGKPSDKAVLVKVAFQEAHLCAARPQTRDERNAELQRE